MSILEEFTFNYVWGYGELTEKMKFKLYNLQNDLNYTMYLEHTNVYKDAVRTLELEEEV